MKYLKFILFVAAVQVCQTISAQTLPSFHAIIFADTNDKNIGKSTSIDLNNVCNMLVEAQSSLKGEMDFFYYIYPGNYCSPENLQRVLKNVPCKPDDVVFFYYTGHGTRSMGDTSPYPQMCLAQHDQAKMISVEGVDRAIARMNPRLRFVITDCCNFPDEFVTPKLEISKGSSMVTSQKEGNYKKLFLNKYGNVIATSSKAGEYSSCNIQIGGFFTYCLLAVMENAIQQNVSDWEVIFKAVWESTRNVSSNRMHPVYNVRLSNTPPDPIPSPVNPIGGENITTQDPLLSDLLQLVDTNICAQKRLNMVSPLLKKHFANAKAQVDALGKDSRTVVNRESAQDFLERLSTSFFLVNFNILSVERDANKKITSLRVHEVYKQE